MRKYVASLLLILLLLAGGGYGYFSFSKTGIFLLHGVSLDQVKLTMNRGILQLSLYEDDNQLGFIVLKKRDFGKGWSFYKQESLPLTEQSTSLKILYPIIQDGMTTIKAVWGGRIKGAASPVPSLAINQIPYTPQFILYEDNKMLFYLLDTDKVEMSDMLTVK